MTTTLTHSYAYTRTRTATYVADKLRVLLSELVREYVLDPKALHDAWSDPIGEAARIWMASGHLNQVTIEFFKPGSDVAEARWDFPIRYDGAGVDDLWVDKSFFRDTIAKSARPPAGCVYRVVLSHDHGAAPVPGMGPAAMKSVASLRLREAGTVVSTPDISASARYYRP